VSELKFQAMATKPELTTTKQNPLFFSLSLNLLMRGRKKATDRLLSERERWRWSCSSPGVEAALLLVAPLHVLEVGHLLGGRGVVHLRLVALRSCGGDGELT